MISAFPATPREILQISSHENLQIVVYTIGCPVQGEMIVTLLLDSDKVIYSTLTDCYIASRRHAIIFAKWCMKIGVSHFDSIFLTHPDEDHCLGVNYLLSIMDATSTSNIFLPSQMLSVRGVSLKKIIKPFRRVLPKYVSKGKLYLQSKTRLQSQVMFEIEFQTSSMDSLMMRFIQLATDDESIFLRNLKTKKGALHNDLSLVYTIHYNDQNFLYCSDLQGAYVTEIDDEYLHNVRFVKIPHHGSPDCKELPALLRANSVSNVVSVTTIYHKLALPDRLPRNEVLSRYVDFGRVYCTGPANEYDPKKIDRYGGVKVHFSMRENNSIEECEGNAYQYVTS